MSRKLNLTTEDGRIIKVNEDIYYYILSLKNEIHDLKYDLARSEKELEAIKPIIERPDYKPAISGECGNCHFVVRSHWSSDIVGCRKGLVCEDFTEKKGRYTDESED